MTLAWSHKTIMICAHYPSEHLVMALCAMHFAAVHLGVIP